MKPWPLKRSGPPTHCQTGLHGIIGGLEAWHRAFRHDSLENLSTTLSRALWTPTGHKIVNRRHLIAATASGLAHHELRAHRRLASGRAERTELRLRLRDGFKSVWHYHGVANEGQATEVTLVLRWAVALRAARGKITRPGRARTAVLSSSADLRWDLRLSFHLRHHQPRGAVLTPCVWPVCERQARGFHTSKEVDVCYCNSDCNVGARDSEFGIGEPVTLRVFTDLMTVHSQKEPLVLNFLPQKVYMKILFCSLGSRRSDYL